MEEGITCEKKKNMEGLSWFDLVNFNLNSVDHTLRKWYFRLQQNNHKYSNMQINEKHAFKVSSLIRCASVRGPKRPP